MKLEHKAPTRERDYLIKPQLGYDYPVVDYGKGIYLYDAEGNQYIDGCSGAVTAGIGHGVEEIIEAMQTQANKVSFAYRTQFTNEAAEALARKLSKLAPGDLNWSFFVNSGSEATETAMKLAIQHWQERGKSGKNRILSRWMSYHGITLGALSMSGHKIRRKRFEPLLEDFPVLSAPYPYRCPFNHDDQRYADEMESAILLIGADQIAAFIAEPIIGASGGAVTPSDGYFTLIHEVCKKYDILFIADEVMTGMGRTGKMFAMEHWNVIPDIVALGKGMSAGYTPIAATLATDRVMEPILNGSGVVMSGHTYSANPQSAAVSLAVLEYVERHRLVEAAAEKGDYLYRKLQQMAQRYPIVGDVRGKGLLLGMELVRDFGSKQPFPLSSNVTSMLINQAFGRGLLIYSAAGGLNGQAGDAVIVAPPLTITTEEIDRLCEILQESIHHIQQHLQSEGLVDWS
ncbi:aspartate aminotransferase family protein [Cohnella sp.]|uniref:aspartate aminotransferase family protein n=1 Tax=Cohnella sp. TaxID=1883426 RepID=UPI0035653011